MLPVSTALREILRHSFPPTRDKRRIRRLAARRGTYRDFATLTVLSASFERYPVYHQHRRLAEQATNKGLGLDGGSPVEPISTIYLGSSAASSHTKETRGVPLHRMEGFHGKQDHCFLVPISSGKSWVQHISRRIASIARAGDLSSPQPYEQSCV